MKLYLGIVNGFFPWMYEDLINQFMLKRKYGILFSFWQFKKWSKKIKDQGLHDYFSYDGPIMIDSGAYSAHQTGIDIPLNKYITFLKDVGVNDGDTIINLDVIGKRKKSWQNWSTLDKKIDHPVLPVVHFPNINLTDYSGPYIGLGGMVPSLKINEKGSVYDVAAWIAKFRSLTTQNFHGFGLGSPFHQVIFKDYLQTIDWIGWRKNAAIGDCYTPEGSRSIPRVRRSTQTRKWLTPKIFETYKPPFLHCFRSLQIPGAEGWTNRALWNVWMFLTAQNHDFILKQSSYVKTIRNRMNQTLSQADSRTLDYYFN